MGDHPTPRIGADLQQISVQHLMIQSLQVFNHCQEFEDAFCTAQGYEVQNLVELDDRRRFVVLNKAKTREARFSAHCRAHEFRDRLPSKEIVATAHNAVKQAMSIRPSEQDLAVLVGKALDIWMINPDRATEYGRGLVWKLAECPKQPYERHFHRRKPSLPIPVIAAALNHLIETYRPAYGKPPHLPDVLDECGRHSDRLIQLHDDVAHLARTRIRLEKLIEFTEDSYPDEEAF